MGTAMYHLVLKDGEAAAEWYQKALEQNDLIAMQIRNSRTLMKPLRESRRWPVLAKMMNPPEAI
jgi:TPR repeat protein